MFVSLGKIVLVFMACLHARIHFHTDDAELIEMFNPEYH